MADEEDKGILGRAYDTVVASITPTSTSEVERRLGNDGRSLKLALSPALDAYVAEHNVDSLEGLNNKDKVLSILAYAGTGYDQAGTSYGDAASKATSGDFRGAAKSVTGSGMWDSWNSIKTSGSTLLTAAFTWIGEYINSWVTEGFEPRGFMAIWNQEYTQSLAFAEADDVMSRLENAKLGLSEQQIEDLGDFTFHRAMARYKDSYPDIDTNIVRRDGDSIIGSGKTMIATTAAALGATLGLTSDGDTAGKEGESPAGAAGSDKVEPPASTTKLEIAAEAPKFEGAPATYDTLAAFTGTDINGNRATTLADLHKEAAVLLPLLPSAQYYQNSGKEKPVLLNLDALKALKDNPTGKFASLYQNIRTLAEEHLIRSGQSSPDSAQVSAEADGIIADTIARYENRGNQHQIILFRETDGDLQPLPAGNGTNKMLTMDMVAEGDRAAAWNAGFVSDRASLRMTDALYRQDTRAGGIQAFRQKATPEQIARGGQNVGDEFTTAFPPEAALPAELAAYAALLQNNKDAVASLLYNDSNPDQKRIADRRTYLSTSEALQIYLQVAALEPEQIDALKDADPAIKALLSDPKIAELAKKTLKGNEAELNDATTFTIAGITTGSSLKAFQEAGVDLGSVIVPKGYAEARTQITVAEAKMLISLREAGLLGGFDSSGEITALLEKEIIGKENGAFINANGAITYDLPIMLGEAKKRVQDKFGEILGYGSQVSASATRGVTVSPFERAQNETATPGMASALAAADEVQQNLAGAASERMAGLQMDKARVQAAVAARGTGTQIAAVIPAAHVEETATVALVPNAKDQGAPSITT